MPLGGIIGGAFRTVGAVAGAAGSSVSAAAPKVASIAQIDEGDVREEAAAYLSDAPSDPAQMTSEGAEAESRVVDIVAAQRKIDRPEAQAEVTRAKQKFVQTKNDTIETAKSATDTAAGAAAGTSFVLVIALLVGAAAAGTGATVGTRRRLR